MREYYTSLSKRESARKVHAVPHACACRACDGARVQRLTAFERRANEYQCEVHARSHNYSACVRACRATRKVLDYGS